MYVNFNDVERIKDAIEMVHGSGINGIYKFDVGYSRRYGMVLKATNIYDVMDEAGFYTEVSEFTVNVPIDHPTDYVIKLPAGYDDKDGLKEYLDDSYADVLVKLANTK